MNTLYYGDNLKILRDYIKAESVDLIYLDPPFNSNRNYNVLFKDESGAEADSQITAFEDTWHWNHSAEQNYSELINELDQVGRMVESFRQFIGTSKMVRLFSLRLSSKKFGRVLCHADGFEGRVVEKLICRCWLFGLLAKTRVDAVQFHEELRIIEKEDRREQKEDQRSNS